MRISTPFHSPQFPQDCLFMSVVFQFVFSSYPQQMFYFFPPVPPLSVPRTRNQNPFYHHHPCLQTANTPLLSHRTGTPWPAMQPFFPSISKQCFSGRNPKPSPSSNSLTWPEILPLFRQFSLALYRWASLLISTAGSSSPPPCLPPFSIFNFLVLYLPGQ